MRMLFAVQGEGRGHMTQAIAFNDLLVRNGHEVVGVLAGVSDHREVPEFFSAAFDCDVTLLASPSFVFKNNRSISLTATALKTLRNLGAYRRSIRRIGSLIAELKPDLLINFYEPTAGLYKRFFPNAVPSIAVGHQFMLEHPIYVATPKFKMQRRGMILFNWLIGSHSHKAALSFYAAEDLPENRLTVAPPLLREQLFKLSPNNEDFLLIYLVNHGYADEIRQWHAEHLNTEIHCFYDKPGAPEEEIVNGNLTFHRLHGEKFLDLMARANGVVCTAGFESVCEAAYLNKPLMMTPVENHVEQELNAIDAANAGFGVKSPDFNLSRLTEFQSNDNRAFRDWVDRADDVYLRLIERVAGRKVRASPESSKPALSASTS